MNLFLSRWLWLFPLGGAEARRLLALLRWQLSGTRPIMPAEALNDHLRYDCGLDDCRPRRRTDHDRSDPYR